jgi:hypothetical protein
MRIPFSSGKLRVMRKEYFARFNNNGAWPASFLPTRLAGQNHFPGCDNVPHLVYSCPVDLSKVQADFKRQQRNSNGWILKLLHCYLSDDHCTLLFESISVAQGFSQDYYVRAEIKGDTFTIRVDSHTNIVKDEGVKRTLLFVRDVIAASNPGLALLKTNLPPELLAEQPQQ